MKKFCMAVGMWVLAVAGSHAEVVATARSPEGAFPEFRVVLDAVGQPVAVANFIGLVDGSQGWVDSETGHVRGGSGDAFYAGMVFDFAEDEVIRGGLRGVVGGEGAVEYTGGPGYTVVGKTNDVQSAAGWGSLALVEGTGPHSGGSEIALFVTNGMTPWTLFGKVAEEDGESFRTLAARVAEGKVTEVHWEVDETGATGAERTTLENARARLPVPQGKEVQVDGEGKVTFDWPGGSQMLVMTGEDLEEGLKPVIGGWLEGTNTMSLTLGWEEIGLEGKRGFAAVTDIPYPSWSGVRFTGKWRMGMDHTGQRLQYWFDFDGKTGMVARIESGEIVERAVFSQVSTWRETGNCIVVYYGRGFVGNFYHLGFAEAGAQGGRFMSEQVVGETTIDWGMFEMAEGWGEEEGKAKRSMHNEQSASHNAQWKMRDALGDGAEGREAGDGSGSGKRWVPWTQGKTPVKEWLAGGAGIGGGQETEAAMRRRGRPIPGRSGGAQKELSGGLFGEAPVFPEEGHAFIHVGKHGGRFGRCGRSKSCGHLVLQGKGFAEPTSESEGNGKGVLKDWVAGAEIESLAGDGDDIGGVGRTIGGSGEYPGHIVEQVEITGAIRGNPEEQRQCLAPETMVPDDGSGQEEVFGGE